ncbi:hypothetical protein GCM10027566_16760 [Arachidicoccus ginsenosidivorans]|uniref:DUF4011 domain-containing protein n=1 Tax=Arachidicoccus ginsenosidivorans TaxID=496057 RepID=A0A5B8VIS4_9BACT|nr:DUF4011 domain-containing protein [Arachidicoccus ginsenosidivorans]QEC70842.1 DUF4011 domain-containing protein [Arachidicoccus ginsenosidivorans]
MLPGGAFQLEVIRLKLKPVFIYSLTERMTASLKLSIRADEEEVYTEEYDIDLLAYDQWLGKSILPEMLSAFVMPNLPELVPILKSTASILGKWTDSSALNDYQSQNPDRVKKQMAALYAVIKEKKNTYCSVPASFGGAGQRVRLVDTVLATGMGNCLEMSLLYASCLEAIGLHPILVLIKGHAFVGAWLVDDTFPDAVNDDPSLLTKRTASGINEMLLIEATAMNEGQSPSFDDAIQLAVNHFADLSAFEYFIDVHRSRFSGIRPMPLRRKIGEEWQMIDHENSVDEKPEISNPAALEQSIKLNHVKEINFGKQQLWERKLLDLSLRNNLLNLRISKTSLQFIPVPPNELEDAMAGGDEFQILARPRDWDNPLRNAGVYQSLNSQDPMLQLVRQELKQKRLRVYVSEEDLYAGLTGLYRSARQALEENGANTLYLAIGLLRWYETPSSERPRFAPILLMPVEIIRKSVKKGFIIRSREEDTVLNITLLEKLRQDYGLALSGLDPLPRDENGVDVKLIFNIIRQTIMSMPRWDVEEQIFLGTFSFSKFIMWNDIHSNADKLKEHPIVAGLINGSLKEPLDYIREENLDHKYGYGDLLLPINADATQLQAISAATAGNSFVLHGPPGTGKSQTITNIIANALYRGKRVLFVAEKMAALSVVQSRLAAIGLAPFCLELHSNKAKKSEVLAQLQKTMEIVRKQAPDSFKSEADRLNQLREVLNEYVEVLHQKQAHGYSLYDLFNEYVQYPEAKDDIPLSAEELSTLDREKWHQWIDTAEELQIAAGLCGDASERNPLYGLEPGEYSSQQKEKIRQELGLFIGTREKLNQILQQVTHMLQWPDGSWTGGQLQKFSELIDGILQLPEIPESFFQTEHLSDFEEALLPLINAGEQRLLRVDDSTKTYLYSLKKGHVVSKGYPIRKSDFGIYEGIEYESHGLFKVLQSKYGYINKQGRVVITPSFDRTRISKSGLIQLRKDHKDGHFTYQYADTTGRFLSDAVYDFKEGMGDDYPYYFQIGQYLVISHYDASVQKNFIGLMDQTGKVIVKPNYTKVLPSKNGNGFMVERFDRWGLLDEAGELILPTVLDNIYAAPSYPRTEMDIQYPVLCEIKGMYFYVTSSGVILPFIINGIESHGIFW